MSLRSQAAFEDVLDGYFPLETSILHFMQRRSFEHVQLYLTHAPILFVPGLALDAPVPLNVTSGRGGFIEEMVLVAQVVAGVPILGGYGRWRWLDSTAPGQQFDPGWRLAEPAYVEGLGPPQLACQPGIAYQ